MNYQINPILSGCTVLELAGVLAGPSVGMFLAELGAKVIKVENPLTKGDVTRSWKLPTESNEDPQSSYFKSVNWGKESVFLNVKNQDDRKRIDEIIHKADIILTSYKPGDAEKLGLTYTDCKKLNPSVIYAAITGFGNDDSRTAYDALIQAETGFMYLNREPGEKPMKMPVALMDILAAHHLKELILIAWINRLKTGEGSHVEVSLIEAAISSLANQAGAWLYAKTDPQPLGSEHPHIYPYGCSFKTGDDRFLILAVGNDAQFRLLCKILGISDWVDDDRFATNQARSQNRAELREILADAFSKQPDAAFLLIQLNEAKVPAGVIRTVGEAVEWYKSKFPMHFNKEEFGIPELAGFINKKRASVELETLTEH